MNHNAPMRPSAFKPIGHYPHDSVVTLSSPVIARPKPQQVTVNVGVQQEDLQRSRSRSNSARTPMARRKSHVSTNLVPPSADSAGGLRAFFRNRTRSISPTKFQAHKNVRRMRTEKNAINTSSSLGNGINGPNAGLGAPGIRRMRTDTAGNIGKYDLYVPTNPKRMTSDTQLQLQLSSDRLQSIDRYRTTVSPMISSDRLHSLSSPASGTGFSPKLTVHRPSPVHATALQASPSAITGTTASGSSFGTISNPNSRNSTTTSWAPRRQLSAFDSLPTLTNSMLPLATSTSTTTTNTTAATSSNSITPINHNHKHSHVTVKERNGRRSITVQDASMGAWIPERHNTTPIEIDGANANGNSNANIKSKNKKDNGKLARSRSRYGARTRFWRFGNRRASMKDETDDSWKAGYMAGLKAGRENSLTAKNVHADTRDDNIGRHPVFGNNDNERSAPSTRKETGKLTRMLSGNGGRNLQINTLNTSGNNENGNRRRNAYTNAPQEFRFGRSRRKRWPYGNNGNVNRNGNGNNYVRERSHDDMSSVTRDSDSYDER